MGRKTIIKIIMFLSIIVVLLAGVTGFLWFLQRSHPQEAGRISISGIDSPIEIIRDENGIPHIYGNTRHDIFFAQGYVHAQDRFWQMETWRRIGSGTLSELFGPDQLETDIFLRTMGFTKTAEEEYKILEPEYQEYLEAYAAGVNAWILSRKPEKIALEFSLLKLSGVEIQVRPWTPVNTLTWAKVMAFDLNGNMDLEKIKIELIRSIGMNNSLGYFSPYRDDIPFIVDREEYISFREKNGLPIKFKTEMTNETQLTSGSLNSLGSNSWVISGNRTETGMPILANDMHLAIQMPSIWYEVDLNCMGENALHVKGFSFAGIPGIIAGHNESIAWGLTNLMMDVQDLYIEKQHLENPDQYLHNGFWKPMKIRYENIYIQGENEPYILRVRSTDHGPILSDHGYYSDLKGFAIDSQNVYPEEPYLTAISLQWTALTPGHIFKSIIKLNEAQDYKSFRNALSYWDSPGQNVIYADKSGNIAYQMTGKAPIRTGGTGHLPMPGWIDDYNWNGYIPFNDMPASLNPEKGYIVTANNPVIDQFYPYYLSSNYEYGYRAKRLVELIEKSKEKISLENIIEMQKDVFNLSAVETISYLKGIDIEAIYSRIKGDNTPDKTQKEMGIIREAYDSLLIWDGIQHHFSYETSVYNYFFYKLTELIFRDQYPENIWPPASIVRFENSLLHLLKNPDNIWWDDRNTPLITENRDFIIGKAFILGVLKGAENLGTDISKWEWGKIHSAEFKNQTLGESGKTTIEKIFNRGPFPLGGGASQVNVSIWEYENPFVVYHLASMRQIIDMQNLSESLMIHTTGQSGHPAHRHYDDFIPLWRDVEYHKNLWRKEDILAEKDKVLTLVPIK